MKDSNSCIDLISGFNFEHFSEHLSHLPSWAVGMELCDVGGMIYKMWNHFGELKHIPKYPLVMT